MSSRSSLCISCQLRAFVHDFAPVSQSWQTRRFLGSGMRQNKKPSRMTLSQNVARSLDDKSRPRRREAGPFSAMNRTEANIPRRAPATDRSERTTRSSSDAPRKANKDERPLFHALKMQATLAPLSYNQRNVLKEKLDKIVSFDELGLRPDVLSAVYTQALPDMETLTPTPAQKLAIPAILSKKGQFEKSRKSSGKGEYDQFLIAAETGSGKTLAYLLPVLNSVKNQEDIDKAEKAERDEREAKEKEERLKANPLEVDAPELADVQNPDSATGRPRALILLPSSELVSQIGKVVKIMSHTIKYRSAPISAANSPAVIKNSLFGPRGIDVVVSTPHLISSIAEKEPNILSRLQYIVVDEADSLLDRSFSPITCDIIDRATPSLKQLILCSATIPRSLDSFIDKRFPQMKRLVTPKLHSIPRRVQLGVLDIEKDPYRGNRDLACADAIWQLGKAVHDDTGTHHTMKNIIVFVNEREKAEEVAKFLCTKGVDATPLTRDTSESRQKEVLADFTSAEKGEGDEKASKPSRDAHIPFDGPTHSTQFENPTKQLPNTRVLVTTDLGSRGIDTLAVRHVILYDVPHTTIDFVHRLGRLGRMNRRGRGIVLVGRKDRKDVVREVREAMFKGQALI